MSAVILLLFLSGLIWIVPVQNYNTEQHFAPRQPVMFSHEHHVGGLGLDCRYCHNSVEISADAGMPPTETCMTCHSQIWTHAEMLAPVRASFAMHKPLRWTTVYKLPDYVFFNHSIHIAKGVGCNECHGQVDKMPLMRRSACVSHAVLPRLSQRSGAASAPARSGLQHGLAAHRRHAVPRSADDRLQDPAASGAQRLRDLSSMSGQR